MRNRKLAHGWEIRKDRLGKSDPRADRRTTAIHEAGHAVMAHVWGGYVMRLKLYNRSNWSHAGHTGVCCWRHPPHKFRRQDPLLVALVSLAGHEAEVVLTGRPRALLPALDLRSVRRFGYGDNTIHVVGWLAHRYVRRYASRIRRVARALLAKGELTHTTFLAAYKGTT